MDLHQILHDILLSESAENQERKISKLLKIQFVNDIIKSKWLFIGCLIRESNEKICQRPAVAADGIQFVHHCTLYRESSECHKKIADENAETDRLL